MAMWLVKVEIEIEAETRSKAWEKAENELGGRGIVLSIPHKPEEE